MISFCYLIAKGINVPAGCIIFVLQVNRAITRFSCWYMIVLMLANNQVSVIFILIGVQNYFSDILFHLFCYLQAKGIEDWTR